VALPTSPGSNPHGSASCTDRLWMPRGPGQLLSWEPRTGLRTGLAETVEWLRGSLAAPTQVGERQ
jgi:nucleoside-diphosphate-sugar epimerase